MAHLPRPWPDPHPESRKGEDDDAPETTVEFPPPRANSFVLPGEFTPGAGMDSALLLPRLTESARGLTGADGAALALSRDGAVRCEARSGSLAPPLGATLDVNSGISGECLRTGRPVRCEDTENDGRVNREVSRELGLRSLAAVPILENGASIGLIEVLSSQPNAFTSEHLEILGELAGLAAASRGSTTTQAAAVPKEEDVQHAHLQAVRNAIAKAAPVVETETELRRWLPIAIPALLLTLLAAVAGGWYYGKGSLRVGAAGNSAARTESASAPVASPSGATAPGTVPAKPSPASAAANRSLGVETAALRVNEPVAERNPAPRMVEPGGRQPRPEALPDSPPPPIPDGNSVEATSTLTGILEPNTDLPTLSLPISQGVTGGKLERRVEPVYPATAKAMRLEGIVVLEATVTKAGALENIRVVNGPALLTGAAVAAVHKWRYSPFLLNGEPVAVQTNIQLQFKLPQ